MKKITFFSLLFASTILLFQNCAGGLPDVSDSATSKSQAPEGSCPFTNQNVLDGQSVTAYSITLGATAADCTAASQTRVCTMGNLSGSFPYSYCSVGTVTTPPAGTPGTSSINLTLATNASNYNIAAAAGNPSGVVTVILTINSGVIVGAANTSTPAIATGTFAAGSTVQIINNGAIYGAGGAGGSGAPAAVAGGAGAAGGPALSLNFPVTITNNGVIGGGGGGGGGGAGCTPRNGTGAGGGGGGIGSPGGAGGGGGFGASFSGAAGGTGSVSSPGAGGASGGAAYCNPGGAGGSYGVAGAAGGTGAIGTTTTPGTPGAPGPAVLTNGQAINFVSGGSAPNRLGVIQ